VSKAAFAGAREGNAAVGGNVERQYVEWTVGQGRMFSAAHVEAKQVELASQEVAHAILLVGKAPSDLWIAFLVRWLATQGPFAAQVGVYGDCGADDQRVAFRRPAQVRHALRQIAHLPRLTALPLDQVDLRRSGTGRNEGEPGTVGRPLG
jgi:hypothetical protein